MFKANRNLTAHIKETHNDMPQSKRKQHREILRPKNKGNGTPVELQKRLIVKVQRLEDMPDVQYRGSGTLSIQKCPLKKHILGK